MKMLIYLILFIVFSGTASASVDFNFSKYVFFDNSSVDSSNNPISENDAMSVHNWTDINSRGRYSKIGSQKVINITMSDGIDIGTLEIYQFLSKSENSTFILNFIWKIPAYHSADTFFTFSPIVNGNDEVINLYYTPSETYLTTDTDQLGVTCDGNVGTSAVFETGNTDFNISIVFNNNTKKAVFYVNGTQGDVDCSLSSIFDFKGISFTFFDGASDGFDESMYFTHMIIANGSSLPQKQAQQQQQQQSNQTSVLQNSNPFLDFVYGIVSIIGSAAFFIAVYIIYYVRNYTKNRKK